MLANISLVATEVIILFILIAFGGIATKLKWLGKDSATQMTNIVLYFSTPCIVIASFNAVQLTPDLVLGLAKTAVIAIVVHLLGILIATFLFRRKPQKQRSVFNVSAVFPNCGFMGIPLVTAILGSQYVIYASVYITIFYVFQWTYGVLQYNPHSKPSLRLMLINTGTISLVAGLIVALLPWALPKILIEPVTMVAALNSPIAMMVLGYYLFTTALRPQKGESGIWVVSAVKLLLIPVIMLVIAFALRLSGMWLVTSLVLAATPSAVNVLLFAARFDGDTALAARVVSICTLLSLITLPILLAVAMTFV